MSDQDSAVQAAEDAGLEKSDTSADTPVVPPPRNFGGVGEDEGPLGAHTEAETQREVAIGGGGEGGEGEEGGGEAEGGGGVDGGVEGDNEGGGGGGGGVNEGGNVGGGGNGGGSGEDGRPRSPGPGPPSQHRYFTKFFASSKDDPQSFTFIKQPGGHGLCYENSTPDEIEHIEDEAGRVTVLSPGNYNVNVFIRLPRGKTIWDIRFKGSPTRKLSYALLDEYYYDETLMHNAVLYPIQIASKDFETHGYQHCLEDATALERPEFEVNTSVFFLSDEYSISFGQVTGVDAKYNREKGGAFDHYLFSTRSFDSALDYKESLGDTLLRYYKNGECLLFKTPQGEAKLVVVIESQPWHVRCDVLEGITIEKGELNMKWCIQELDHKAPLFTV